MEVCRVRGIQNKKYIINIVNKSSSCLSTTMDKCHICMLHVFTSAYDCNKSPHFLQKKERLLNSMIFLRKKIGLVRRMPPPKVRRFPSTPNKIWFFLTIPFTLHISPPILFMNPSFWTEKSNFLTPKFLA